MSVSCACLPARCPSNQAGAPAVCTSRGAAGEAPNATRLRTWKAKLRSVAVIDEQRSIAGAVDFRELRRKISAFGHFLDIAPDLALPIRIFQMGARHIDGIDHAKQILDLQSRQGR